MPEPRVQGLLWVPSANIVDDVRGDGSTPDDNDKQAGMVSSPYTKYIFVRPQAQYNVQQYINWRDDNATLGDATINSVGGFVFFLGDSSSCGGTIIQRDPDDPMQAFLNDDETKAGFAGNGITRGGFFLLGDRQGVGTTAVQIKLIMEDLDLNFLVLALHRRPGSGTQPDISVAAFRHLVASIRWDVGPETPIILMVGDENDNVHLMAESNRGNLFVGDISDQDTEAKQVALIDRAGTLSLNWWPLMAFVPNADNGSSIANTMVSMQNKLFHPMLIPASGSGCPFNTTRALTVNELAEARARFVTPSFVGPVADPKVRTTSMWFWDFETVKNNSRVQNWSVLRGNLDGTFGNIDYMSDMNVVFRTLPGWVSHPIYNMPFAMEIQMSGRSSRNRVLWDKRGQSPGNIPALHGVKEQFEGWLTVITPFELSPTANKFYRQDVTNDNRGVPVIPPWVEFTWLREIEASEIADGSGSGWLGIPGFISNLLELAEDALVYLPNAIFGDLSNDAGFKKWSAGLNQPRVIMHGTPGISTGVGIDEDGVGVTIQGGVDLLKLENAPFALQVQTLNFKMGPEINEETGEQLGFVWPARVFNIIPISISDTILQMFDPVGTPPGFNNWQDLGFSLDGHGGTPVTFEADEVLQSEFLSLHIPDRAVLLPLLDNKADFPPMMDSNDPVLQRDFSSHLARIDITHPRVLRSREPNFGGRTGGGGGFATKGVLTNWPIPDDREITITQDFFGTEKRYTCGPHRALDLVYTDRSADRTTPILAAGPGRVTHLFCDECGPYIEITHEIPPLPSQVTFRTQYLHLDRRLNNNGALVEGGDIIGFMGDRGSPGALHLHFAINMDGTCDTAQNPCDELPAPANGTVPECVGTPVEELICNLFGDAIAAGNHRTTITDRDNFTLPRVDAALAIARFESTGGSCGLAERAQNCVTIDGVRFSHVGLFQIQNKTHILNDAAAGNISLDSVVTNDPECPGVEIAQDYKIARNNILAAIRISGAGSNFDQWATWTQRDTSGQLYYKQCLGGGCP